MKRVGVLGGSFDPIHFGHLWIATLAREQLDLDRVLLLPTASPPHKGRPIASYAFRVELVRLAIAGLPGLVVSDMESDETKPSYTVDTLRQLRDAFPRNDEIWLLIGGDALRDLPTWREPDEIARLCSLGIYGRPGYAAEVPRGVRARWIDGPLCGLSSSWIRRRLISGESIAPFVPTAIVPRLEGHGPYRKA